MNIQFITSRLYHGNVEHPFCPQGIYGHFIPPWVPMGLHNFTEPELSFRPLVSSHKALLQAAVPSAYCQWIPPGDGHSLLS